MNIKEIKEKNSIELGKMLTEKRSESLQLRFDIQSKQAKTHRKYRNCKRNIARIMTVLNNKEAK